MVFNFGCLQIGDNMKTLIAFMLMAASFNAAAETWVTKSESGGEIVLTDRPCAKYKSLRVAYARNPDGSTIEGCWTYMDHYVHVAYYIGEKRVYDPAIFTKMETY